MCYEVRVPGLCPAGPAPPWCRLMVTWLGSGGYATTRAKKKASGGSQPSASGEERVEANMPVPQRAAVGEVVHHWFMDVKWMTMDDISRSSKAQRNETLH